MGELESHDSAVRSAAPRRVIGYEWLTLAALAGAYGLFAFGLWLWTTSFWFVAPALLAVTAAFHGSLQHETIHDHPTPHSWLNEALASLPLMGIYPFRRYRALHLQHHNDASLTDPYDDPESYFWPPDRCLSMSRPLRLLLEANNTLVGRLLVGPGLGIAGFLRTEWPLLIAGAPGVRKAWLLHVVGLAGLIALVSSTGMPVWVYFLLVSYPALSLTMLRSFAEHQAAEEIGHRSAVVEAGRAFSLLYLNNNLHIVHHAAPGVSWYDLPALYEERHANYLAANGGYRFAGYGEIFRRFAFHQKQPVEHPFLGRPQQDPGLPS